MCVARDVLFVVPECMFRFFFLLDVRRPQTCRTRALFQVMTGESVEDMNPPKLYETGRPQGYVGCKAPMFSFTRLR